MLCPYCKEEIADGAIKCKHCQSMLGADPARGDISSKNFVSALLLCLLLGGAGAHRFYAGKTGTAAMQLALCILGAALIIVPIINIAVSAPLSAIPISELARGIEADIYDETFAAIGESITVGGAMKAGAWITFAALLLFALGIWVLIDLIKICTGNFKDSGGKRIKNS